MLGVEFLLIDLTNFTAKNLWIERGNRRETACRDIRGGGGGGGVIKSFVNKILEATFYIYSLVFMVPKKGVIFLKSTLLGSSKQPKFSNALNPVFTSSTPVLT